MSTSRNGALLVAESPTTEELGIQMRIAHAQHAAASAIEQALKDCGQPYYVWIIAAEQADSYAKEAAELSTQIMARALPEVSTCEAA
jgi:hypothetical protein